jgi:hypothetical protein
LALTEAHCAKHFELQVSSDVSSEQKVPTTKVSKVTKHYRMEFNVCGQVHLTRGKWAAEQSYETFLCDRKLP